MRYKGEYGPSELLDPATNRWMPLDEPLKKQLAEDPSAAIPSGGPVPPGDGDEPGYSILSHMPGLMSPEELAAFDLGRVKVRLRGTAREDHVAEVTDHSPPTHVLLCSDILGSKRTFENFTRCRTYTIAFVKPLPPSAP